MKLFLLIVIHLIFINVLSGQAPEDSVTIEEVFISVERLPNESRSSIKSITTVAIDPLRVNSAAINDYVEEVPGLYITNGFNYAQDSRIAIRGFGGRSAFGIRGVKLIVDGIPETTPDGQGQLDNINVAAIRQIEVLKSGASSLYGNASGGVINITTQREVTEDYIEASAAFGSFGLQRYDIATGYKINASNLLFNANYTDYTGYRDNSELRSYNLNGRWNIDLDKHSVDVIANYTNSPTANDPGGINLEQAIAEPRSAREQNLTFQSGEAIDHFKLGVNHTIDLGDQQTIENYAFYSRRNFVGRLPFGFSGEIDLGRTYYGLGSAYRKRSIYNAGVNMLQLGVDIGIQSDARDRFVNLNGERGDLVFSQIEGFQSYGIYLIDRIELNRWSLEGGLRYDLNRLTVDDLNLTNGDNSDAISLSSFNPNVGVSYRLAGETIVRAQVSTSFETPTLSELSADPEGTEGFNEDLAPMRATTLELGLRTAVSGLEIDVSLFSVNTNNEIISFELEQFPDRDFFRNAGSTSRRGVELSIDYDLGEQVHVRGTYGHINAQFDEFEVNGTDLEGNSIPGIPQNRFTLSGNWTSDYGLSVGLQYLSTGRLYVNDQNTISTEAFDLLNLYSSYKIKTARITITPFINVANLTGTQYFSNIRINAFGSRFYEPAPDRQFIGGVSVTF
jgi:iron complex outermembrane receptor protein